MCTWWCARRHGSVHMGCARRRMRASSGSTSGGWAVMASEGRAGGRAFGRSGPSGARSVELAVGWPAKLHRNRSNFVQHWSKPSRLWSILGRHCPDSIDIGPESATVGPAVAEFEQTSAKFGLSGPEFDCFSTKLVRFRAHFGQLRPDVDRLGTRSIFFAPHRPMLPEIQLGQVSAEVRRNRSKLACRPAWPGTTFCGVCQSVPELFKHRRRLAQLRPKLEQTRPIFCRIRLNLAGVLSNLGQPGRRNEAFSGWFCEQRSAVSGAGASEQRVGQAPRATAKQQPPDPLEGCPQQMLERFRSVCLEAGILVALGVIV